MDDFAFSGGQMGDIQHQKVRHESLILNNHICYAAFGMQLPTFQNRPDCCHCVSQIKLIIDINSQTGV